MKTWFKNLSTIWKVVIIAALIILAVIIYDLFTGGVRDFKNWSFDRKEAKIEETNKKLELENEFYRKQIQGYLVEIEKGKVREEAVDAALKQKGVDVDKVISDTEKALEEVRKEEEITAQPTDSLTRCMRTKEKLIALKIKSAGDIDCENIQ